MQGVETSLGYVHTWVIDPSSHVHPGRHTIGTQNWLRGSFEYTKTGLGADPAGHWPVPASLISCLLRFQPSQ